MAGVDPLSLISYGVGGVADLLKAMGVFKDPAVTAEENRRKAMRDYLTANMPELNYTDKQYTPADFAEVLNPMQERQGTQEQAFGNSIGLRGLGRSGVGAEMILQNNRRNTQDYAGKLGSLIKSQKATDYAQALEKYKADLNKAQIMAGVQG